MSHLTRLLQGRLENVNAAVNKAERRFATHQERLEFDRAILEGRSVAETFTPQAITLVFISLGTKALRARPADPSAPETKP